MRPARARTIRRTAATAAAVRRRARLRRRTRREPAVQRRRAWRDGDGSRSVACGSRRAETNRKVPRIRRDGEGVDNC